jgi:hypothetical protein
VDSSEHDNKVSGSKMPQIFDRLTKYFLSNCRLPHGQQIPSPLKKIGSFINKISTDPYWITQPSWVIQSRHFTLSL